MFKKLLATAATLLLAAGLSVIAVAAPASAHTGALTGVASCQTDGTYTITWTYKQTNTPSSGAGSQADVKIIKHEPQPSLIDGANAQKWLNAWSSPDHSNSNGQTGIPTRTGNWTQTFTQSGIVGTAKKATADVQVDWEGWGSVEVYGSVTLAGNCTIPDDTDKKIDICHANNGNGYVSNNVSYDSIIKPNGHATHQGDIIPPFTYTKNGVTTGFAGLNWTPEGQAIYENGCEEPPVELVCLPKSAVSYTYVGTTNSGVVTVVNPDPSKYTDELCEGFWVTATSWKYTDDDKWPQTLDVVDYVNDLNGTKQKITEVGSYPYSAPMTCGQGDIYASFIAQPEPTPVLLGPDNPFDEVFLHEMGFTGPNPTYFNQPEGCNEATPVEPTITTVVECGTYGSVTAVPATGVVYDVQFDKVTGAYTVTATPAANYYFDNADQEVVYSGNVGAYYDCVEEPHASIAYGECVYEEDGTADSRTVEITFDNSGSNKSVLFQVTGFPQYDQKVPAGQTVTFPVEEILAEGGSYTVTAGGKSFELPIAACAEPEQPKEKTREVVDLVFDCYANDVTVTTTTFTTPYVFNTETATWELGTEDAGVTVVTHRTPTDAEKVENCAYTIGTDPTASSCEVSEDGTDLASWIRVDLDPRVEYRIDGVLVTEEYTSVVPGSHEVVATAAVGFVLTPEAEKKWTLFAEDTTNCQLPPLAIVTPLYQTSALTCTAAGTYTLGELEPGTISWTVNGAPATIGQHTVTAPGTYELVATPAIEGDGLNPDWLYNAENPLVLTFAFPADGCVKTLALTGVAGVGGVTLIGGLFVIGGMAFFFLRRRTAE